ncbi:hypothetical protein [Streptomyces sp. NRRL S-474]|uniref:hypothetical protein n=1 Tax=Streptomyces sp. NRRL S-474 TaxID=1463909 RepID=UPI00131BF14B|nr:hypothetical protein [Streptomyces sp. NRRL S-474]
MGLLGFGMWAWFLPTFFVTSAAIVPSGQAWEIAEAGETIRSVSVEKVLKTERVQSGKTSRYANEVQVSVPFDGGPRVAEGEYYSQSTVEVGDLVYALYAPSSPNLGALIDSSPNDLKREIGGPAGIVEILLVLMYVGAFGWFYWLVAQGQRSVRAVRDAIQKRNVRSLPVAVEQVRVKVDERPAKGTKSHQPKPCLRVSLADGGHLDLYLDQEIDPMGMVPLEGTQAQLYWCPPQQSVAYEASVGYAFLVWSDQRYLPGWLETPDGSDLPAGEVTTELPERFAFEAIRPSPVMDPGLYVPAVVAMLFGVLALLIVGFGAGSFATFTLGAVAFLSPFVAKNIYRSRLTRKLQDLAQGMAGPESNRTI